MMLPIQTIRKQIIFIIYCLPFNITVFDPSCKLTKTSLAICPQLFHSKLKTLLLNKSNPDSSSSFTSLSVSTLSTIHLRRLTVCLILWILTPCLMVLFWLSACIQAVSLSIQLLLDQELFYQSSFQLTKKSSYKFSLYLSKLFVLLITPVSTRLRILSSIRLLVYKQLFTSM